MHLVSYKRRNTWDIKQELNQCLRLPLRLHSRLCSSIPICTCCRLKSHCGNDTFLAAPCVSSYSNVISGFLFRGLVRKAQETKTSGGNLMLQGIEIMYCDHISDVQQIGGTLPHSFVGLWHLISLNAAANQSFFFRDP